jgi:cephalosporin hydroxylase
MKISDDFHKWYEMNRIWENTKWLGVPMWKLPFDAFVIQELIHNIRPDYVIETGTGCGGSAVFYASIFQLLDHGRVITIDVDNSKHEWCYDNEKVLDRITFILGNSVDIQTTEKVESLVNKHCLVLLDSWHSYEHVLLEMNLYSKFVSIGSYMIIEDTHVNRHPIEWRYGKGPYEAVEDFLKINDNFIVDENCERHDLTFNPNGYLRRIK